jgi:hypothetical protein
MNNPRPDLLSALPEIIAVRVKLTLPDLRTCRGQAGRFDLEALKKMSIAAPAVLIATTRLSQAEIYAGPHLSYSIEMAAFVITKDALGLPRDTAAANICQALITLIPEKTWGEPGVGAAQGVVALPLITAAQDKFATSLWAVSWRHQIAFTPLPADTRLPIVIYAPIDVLHGADDPGDYEPVGGDP